MIGAILSFISGLLGKLLGGLLGKKPAEPTVAEVSEAKGAVEQREAQAEKTIAIHEQAAAARTSADARILREQEQPAPFSAGPGATSGIDADPDGNWRD